MKQLKEIKNYLVFHNGTIECHPENVGIAINGISLVSPPITTPAATPATRSAGV